MNDATHDADRFPSGMVVRSMVTTPDVSTMFAQARLVGVDADAAHAAIGALTSGTAAAVVVSGKLASGKDTVAATVAARLPELGMKPAVIHQTSGPMREEYRQMLDIVASASTPDQAADLLVATMALPAGAAAHMASILFGPTRDAATMPDPNERTDLNRHILQYHADHGRRSTDPEYWTKQFFQAVYRSLAEGHSVLLTGCRYPNEIGPAQTLGLMTVRLVVSRAVQEQRLWGRDGLTPKPELLDDPNECALDDYVGFNLAVGNDGDLAPTVDQVADHTCGHVARLAS